MLFHRAAMSVRGFENFPKEFPIWNYQVEKFIGNALYD
jgi:hypothetical protein